MIMNNKIKAYIALLITAIIWGIAFVVGKIALSGASPFTILFWRFLFSSVVCMIIFNKKLCFAPKATIISGLILGIVQVASLGLQLTGLIYTSAAKQSFLYAFYVPLTPFISWIFTKKRPGLKLFVCAIVALIGVGFLCFDGDTSVNIGDVLSLVAAGLFSLQVVLVSRFTKKDTDSIQLSFFQFISAGIVSFLICLITGENLIWQSTASLFGILYLAIPVTCLAFLIINITGRYTEPSTAALILSLESVFGFIFSLVYYKEPVTIRLIVGAILCFSAVLVNVLDKDASKERNKEIEV